MPKMAIRPYLVSKRSDGQFSVTVRRTRFNSQNYPIVTSTIIDETFPTGTAAKAYVRAEYDAVAADIATNWF